MKTTKMMMIMMTTMMTISLMMNKKTKKNMYKNKSSPFECGFNSMNNKRMPLSIQFYMISIMFLIFDLEIMMIMSLNKSNKSSNQTWWSMSTITLMMFLLVSLMMEWKTKKMKWK